MAMRNTRAGAPTPAPRSPHVLPLLTFLLSLSLSLLPLFPLASSKSTHFPAALRRLRVRRGAGKGPTITYHGGPVLGRDGPVSVHLLYYGNWATQSGRTQQKMIKTFVSSLSADAGQQGDGGVPTVKMWWASVAQYYGEDEDGKRFQVNPNVRLGSIVFDKYSLGKRWTNDSKGVWAAISKQLDAGRFPVDPDAIYVLLASPDMNIAGMCSDYCGWHDKQDYGDTVLAYALVTDASKCADTCGYKSPAGPGRTGGMEGTVDTLGHELIEAVTDPDVSTGWFTDNKAYADDNENGDLCGGSGTPKEPRKNGSYVYNVVGLGNTPFALQQVFNRVTQACELQAQAGGAKVSKAPLAFAPGPRGEGPAAPGAPADSPAATNEPGAPDTATVTPVAATPSAGMMAPATVTPMSGDGVDLTAPPAESPTDPSAAPPCSYFDVGPAEGNAVPTTPPPAPLSSNQPSFATATDPKAFFILTLSAAVGALLVLLA